MIKKYLHHALAVPYFIGLFIFKLLSLALGVIGLFVVAAAIPFRRQALSIAPEENGVKNTIWVLPDCVKWFSNSYDGLKGDSRGWWDDNCDAQVFWGLLPWLRQYIPSLPVLDKDSYLSMWWWSSVRNPTNHFGRNILGVDASLCRMVYLYGDAKIRDKQGMNGYYLALYVNESGIPFYVLEYCKDKGDGYAIYAQLGLKLRPYSVFKEGDPRKMKSLTFEVNINKDIS
jgi:hypothetical protein